MKTNAVLTDSFHHIYFLQNKPNCLARKLSSQLHCFCLKRSVWRTPKQISLSLTWHWEENPTWISNDKDLTHKNKADSPPCLTQIWNSTVKALVGKSPSSRTPSFICFWLPDLGNGDECVCVCICVWSCGSPGLNFKDFHIFSLGFPGASVVENLPAITRDVGSTPRSGRSLGEGNCRGPRRLEKNFETWGGMRGE